MSVTLKQIAQELGLSVTTVCKALKGRPDVGEETRRRVEAAARRLNYQPNLLAKRLVTRRTQTIGLFLVGAPPKISHPFSGVVIDALLEELGQKGYDVLLFGRSHVDSAKSFASLAVQRQLDAAVFMGLRTDDPRIEDLSHLTIPMVTLDLPLVDLGAICVGCDHTSAAREAVRHLLQLGHRRIGFINGHPYAAVSHERRLGYQLALAEAGLPVNEVYIRNGEFTPEGGYRAMVELLQLEPRPTAVFCASDLMALGALRAANDRGFRVPDDLSLVGYDDITEAEHCVPPLTTVHQPRQRLGEALAEAAIGAVEQPAVWRDRARILLHAHLVIRKSTAPPARHN